jgi:hypothetical protein
MKTSEKITTATGVLRRCIGEKGVWADPSRYRWQCWTRDLALAIMPALIEIGEAKVVRKHLENLSLQQRQNGQIPILFLDRRLPFLIDKARRSLSAGRISFMLGRYLRNELWNLTPGTKDSEILYVVGMHEYANRTGDRTLLERYRLNIELAVAYIENELMDAEGLVFGCDWRDTMERQLGDTPLLTNNCLLYHAYDLMGEKGKAMDLRDAINNRFWNGVSYLDYPGNDRFDPLGGALAVLYGVSQKGRHESLAASFRSVDTPLGVAIKCRHNPVSSEEKAVIERTDGVVVWPFVVGFSVIALANMGEREMAEEQFRKLSELDGFREWYDPATGQGYGAQEQLWSATLFLRAARALNKG